MLEPQDHNLVSGQIASLDQRLSHLEAVELKLSEELNEIRERINDLRNQRAALESRIAVIWSLPNEILSHIFEIGLEDEGDKIVTLDDEENHDDDNNVEHLSFNILVSHVCRAFREVAIHTPTLWSQIHILDLEPPRLDFVRACVQRSWCSRLDIMIDCEDGHLDADAEPVRQLMEILDPHIDRFERFTVRLCGIVPLYHVMQHLSTPAPQLKHLELVDVDYEYGFNENDSFEPASLREPLTLFGGIIPKLKVLALDGAHVAWAKCNFKGLTDLHLGYHTLDVRPTYEEFKTIIEASPGLHTLGLRGSSPLISDDTAQSSLYAPLHMERLEVLHISDIPSDYATTLISLFNTPNLASLSLTDLDINNDYSAFFSRIIGPPVLFPALTALKLASIEANDNAIEDLLRASSKLTRLALYFKRMPTSWLAFLEPRGPENEVLCPNLKCLKCVSASPSKLKQLLEKRRDAGIPIPTLQVDKETERSEEKIFMNWIKENVTLEIIEPSEHDTNETGSDWATDDETGLPYLSLDGFSDEDEDDDEDEDEDDEDDEEDEEGDENEESSEMEVDETDDSGNEEE